MRIFAIALALASAVVAGLCAAYGYGYTSAWLDSWQQRWYLPSDRLAERAYARQLNGKPADGLPLFRLAVERNPASPYRWCDYAEALLLAGRPEEAKRAMGRGLALGPYVGPIGMRGVNFAYRTSDRQLAIASGRHLLAIAPDYDDAIFTVWSHMDISARVALERAIPDVRSAQSYLRFQVTAGDVDGAKRTWSWLAKRDGTSDSLAGWYLSLLTNARDYGGAERAWQEYAHTAAGITNGGFESEPRKLPYDWHFDSVPGVRAERDRATAAEGRYSLRLDFDGTANASNCGVWQKVLLSPGKYLLSFKAKADQLSTDQGVSLAAGDGRSDRLAGSMDWTAFSVPFSVREDGQAVELRLVRQPSLKFDNKINGTLWIDSVAIRPQ